MFRGPTLFVGYHNQPALTAATRDAEGWFTTGDRGYVDEDGYLYYSGRAKEVINRGGTKIYPKAVEEIVAAHPNVVDVAVVAMPDERLGERVCAYVVLREGTALTLEALREHFAALEAMKSLVPEALVAVDALPMTPTGKVAKATLVADAAERAQNGELMR